MVQTKYDVFISYSRKDYVDEHKNVIPGNEVSKIKEALSEAGITFWFDEKGIYHGDEFAGVIADAIDESSLFVFISSENSNDSDWTLGEIATAQEAKKKIIPVRIDSARYHKSLRVRLNALDYIDYKTNPEKGRQELVRSIKAYLEEAKAIEAEKVADEKRRQEELERQRKLQEEEEKRKEQIVKIETEIAALESQKIERKKVVLQKEQELKFAQVDLEACETKILKLQTKLVDLQSSRKEEKKRNVKVSNSKATYDSERTKEMGGYSGVSKPTIVVAKAKTNRQNKRIFSSRSDVFTYVKSNSKYPISLSNDFDIDSSISWTVFTAKLYKEYGIVITKEGIVNIKGLVNRIWNASK